MSDRGTSVTLIFTKSAMVVEGTGINLMQPPHNSRRTRTWSSRSRSAGAGGWPTWRASSTMLRAVSERGKARHPLTHAHDDALFPCTGTHGAHGTQPCGVRTTRTDCTATVACVPDVDCLRSCFRVPSTPTCPSAAPRPPSNACSTLHAHKWASRLATWAWHARCCIRAQPTTGPTIAQNSSLQS